MGKRSICCQSPPVWVAVEFSWRKSSAFTQEELTQHQKCLYDIAWSYMILPDHIWYDMSIWWCLRNIVLQPMFLNSCLVEPVEEEGHFLSRRRIRLFPCTEKNISSDCVQNQKSIKLLVLRRSWDGHRTNIMSRRAMGIRIKNIVKLRGLCVKIKYR